MSGPPTYTPYHPKWYRRPVSTYWWLQRGAYLRFILRELSSVFIAYFVTVTLIQIYTLTRGRESYARFEAWTHTPLAIVLNLITFFFVVFHAVTWFNLAPKAMVVHMGKKPVPAAWVVAGNYLAWFVATAVVALFFVTYHAITWFNLAPKALVVHLRGKPVPGGLIAASNYAAWLVASAVVAWVVLGG